MPQLLPVLGLFKDEYAFRDHVAGNLAELEDGLTLIKKEYEIENRDGADGRLDILALDTLDHVVVIELKRSDNSARATLHELSKYITLLIQRDRVPREMIRCIVVSTNWNELLLPLSYFATTAGVHIRALNAVRKDDGTLGYREKVLVPIRVLPQFSPEISIYQYLSEEDREAHLAHVRVRANRMPFVRLALMLLDRKDERASDIVPYRSVACIWRVSEADQEKLEQVTGNRVGWLEPYAFPGWEAECDTQFWLASENAPGVHFSTAEEERGTAEKIGAMLVRYKLAAVERFGDWPGLEVVNSDEKILKQLEAVSNLVSAGRTNRYTFDAKVSPRFAPSWNQAVAGFLEFISFDGTWAREAERYITEVSDPDLTVRLCAFDNRHFFYAIHQALNHPDAELSTFEIVVEKCGKMVEGLRGSWAWDGMTCPSNAGKSIERIYGSVSWAVLALFSAADNQRYELAYRIHGFCPVVDLLRKEIDGQFRTENIVRAKGRGETLQDFVRRNGLYAQAVSEALGQFGDIPTQPVVGGTVQILVDSEAERRSQRM